MAPRPPRHIQSHSQSGGLARVLRRCRERRGARARGRRACACGGANLASRLMVTVNGPCLKMNQLESHADRDQLGDDSEASDSEQQLSEEAKALLQTADEEAARWQNVRVVLHPLRQSTDDVLAGDTCASGMQL